MKISYCTYIGSEVSIIQSKEPKQKKEIDFDRFVNNIDEDDLFLFQDVNDRTIDRDTVDELFRSAFSRSPTRYETDIIEKMLKIKFGV